MRSVIVTGGTRGLGAGIAEKLADEGFQVIAIARRSTEAFDLAKARIDHKGIGGLEFHPANLLEIEAIPDLVKTIRSKYGRIYGLVNNAGIGTSGLLTSISNRAIEELLRLNIHAPIAMTKYTARAMMAGGAGRIVNISSIVASTGYTGLSVYSATKASLIGFTKSLARELGPLGITVNAVAPGFVETDMTYGLDHAQVERIKRRSALKRMAEVGDVAEAVAFLFSDKASNITGTVMTVDAGNTA